MPKSLRELADLGEIHASWLPVLDPVEDVIHDLGGKLRAEVAAGHAFAPRGDHILRAFRTPLPEVRVLILGQDPYPTPGHAIGLSFAVAPDVRPIPRSLANIYRELESDLGIPPAPHGDLTRWTRQGVLLLNRCLTVRTGSAAAHRGWGWETVTDRAVRALADVAEGGQPVVAVLWGRDAQSAAPLLRQAGDAVEIIATPHPSPLSASRGFFGSRPFSRVNAALTSRGAAPIDWRVEGD